ncbi:MAG: hypothetical protein KAU49_04570 [Candidatus Krumholzibacteria bacterium]|nr:hypothetical protein [Candidatus Krumholzibacteria bacterium]
MRKNATPKGCIPRGRLEALAIRALGGVRAAGAPEKDPTAIVADLFQPGEWDFRSHLEACEMCRETLKELIEFVSYYRQAVETADIDLRFDILMRNVSLSPSEATESVSEGIELFYEPYTRPFDEEPSLAAATERPERKPVRFCSGDGNYVLREFTDIAKGKPSYFLVGERGIRTSNIEVVVDEHVVVTDQNGLLDTDFAGFSISKDSKIHVRTKTSN